MSYRMQSVFFVVLFPAALAGLGAWQAIGVFSVITAPFSIHTAGEWLRFGLGGAAAAAGALSAGMGALSLLRIDGHAKKALRSQEALVKTFQASLKRLPWVVTSCGLLTALALVFCLGAWIVHLLGTGQSGSFSAKITGMALLVIAALFGYCLRLIRGMTRAARATFTYEPRFSFGVPARREDFPLVWAMVEKTARTIGSELPDNIVLGLEPTFYVTQVPVSLEEGVLTGRTLYLSTPLMLFLDRESVAGIIAHELGHFMGKDCEFSMKLLPLWRKLEAQHESALDSSAQLEDEGLSWISRPVACLGDYYHGAFRDAVSFWSRERERAADRKQAAVCSPAMSALGLLRIVLFAPHVDKALAEAWKGETSDVLPRVLELVKTEGLADPAQVLARDIPHPWDSHPTIAERLALFGVDASPSLLATAASREARGVLAELGLAPGQAGAGESSGSVQHTLQTQFVQTAKAVRKSEADEESRKLREQAAYTAERMAFYESGLRRIVFWLGLGGFAAFLFALGGYDDLAGQRKFLAIDYSLIGAAIFCIPWGIYWVRRYATPVLIIDANGFSVPGFGEKISWLHLEEQKEVEEEGFLSWTWGSSFKLVLNEKGLDKYRGMGSGPARKLFGRASYDAENGIFSFKLLPFRGGVDMDEFCGLFQDAWFSSWARRELARQGRAQGARAVR